MRAIALIALLIASPVLGKSLAPPPLVVHEWGTFTTLTSTGLSDVVPILPHARSLVMIEQVAGLMYVALVISRIVGLTLYGERRDRA